MTTISLTPRWLVAILERGKESSSLVWMWDLNKAVTAIQCDAGEIKRAQSFSRARLLGWVQAQVRAGHTVHTVYEACGFGYTLHSELMAAGAHSLVTTPMRHTLQRRRKNDRMDARELCVRLSRYLDGHRDELKPIRIPSSEEQQRRELGRQREFFKQELRRLENHGRALRIEFEHETLPGGWAGPRKWKRLSVQCSSFVRQQLEPIVTQIRACRDQLARLTVTLEARVAEQMIPTGLGALTIALLDGEVCNRHRFQHRKAVGSYTGCCPSEYSTGGAALWLNRSAGQQTRACAPGGSSVAPAQMAATVACPAKVSGQT